MDLEKFNLPRYLATLPLFSNMRDEELQRLATGIGVEQLYVDAPWPTDGP